MMMPSTRRSSGLFRTSCLYPDFSGKETNLLNKKGRGAQRASRRKAIMVADWRITPNTASDRSAFPTRLQS